jgi:peptidoglycan/xylan/chitin deacetylase (PgdA/CDA1 family)
VIAHALAPIRPAAADHLGIARWLPGADGVALTFDDGPHPEGTPRVLDALARADAHATFFVVGEQVRKRPSLLAEIESAGHLVALHGDRHQLQLRRSAAALREDLVRGAAAIEDVLGHRPVWHRPPYGIYSSAGLDATRFTGLRPLLWSRWGKDWRKFTTPGQIARRVLSGVLPGDVILLHDADFYSANGSHNRTAVAVDLITTELKRRKIGTVLPV